MAPRADVQDLRRSLRHVRWVGGGTGGGKSSIAHRLAEEHGLRVYSSDEASRAHLQRSTPATHPLLHSFVAMDMDERWVQRPPELMLATFHGFQGETFPFIVDDVLALPPERPILAEGFRLLPRLVAPLLSRPQQAVWLAPSPEFRRLAFEARGFTWQIAGRTSDPERALANLLARDRLFTEQVVREARGLGLAVIAVDVGLSFDALVESVRAALGLGHRSS